MKRLNGILAACMNCFNDKKGQTVVEYALILLLIAIIVVAMLRGIGVQTNNMYSTVNSAIPS